MRWVYELYTVESRSIGAITRMLDERQIPTSKNTGRWKRSTVWAILRNPRVLSKDSPENGEFLGEGLRVVVQVMIQP